LRDWNPTQYQEDTKASKDWQKFRSTETGKLFTKVYTRIHSRRSQHQPIRLTHPPLKFLICEDIEGFTAYDKAERRMKRILESTGGPSDNNVDASLRAAQGSMSLFRELSSPCYRQYQRIVTESPHDVAVALYDLMERRLQELMSERNEGEPAAVRQHWNQWNQWNRNWQH
ncbi:hypothetical protein EV360DRAFT_71724, partial [Lentinula raphanica]